MTDIGRRNGRVHGLLAGPRDSHEQHGHDIVDDAAGQSVVLVEPVAACAQIGDGIDTTKVPALLGGHSVRV